MCIKIQIFAFKELNDSDLLIDAVYEGGEYKMQVMTLLARS